MWMSNRGEKYGDVVSVQTNYIKVRDNVTGKMAFLPKDMRGIKVFPNQPLEERIPYFKSVVPLLTGVQEGRNSSVGGEGIGECDFSLSETFVRICAIFSND